MNKSQADAAIEALVAAHSNSDNPATDALLYLARRAGIAIAWLDRQAIERSRGEALTDEQWELLKPELAEYDDHVSSAAGVESDFLESAFAKAGVEYIS